MNWHLDVCIDSNGVRVPDDELAVGTRRAAAYCGVSAHTVRRWYQRGLFVDGHDVWDSEDPRSMRPSLVFRKSALLLVKVVTVSSTRA